jgi:predicted Zn-dependent peptidase
MEQLDKLKRGDFDDAFLESIKLNLIRQYQLGYESNYRKAMMMADAFFSNTRWEDLVGIPEKIQAIDKTTIIQKANQYFGENRLILYSKMGFPKKNKLDKPPFTPALAKGKESAYGKSFREAPEPDAIPRYVNINSEVTTLQVKPLVTIHQVKNPVNNIFSLEVRYGTGRLIDEKLPMLGTMLKYAGTDNLSRDDFKRELGNLATTYDFYTSDVNFSMQLQGFDANLKESLLLAGQLIDKPLFNEKGRKNAVSFERFERRMEKKNINEKSFLLSQYQQFGEASYYLNRMAVKEMKKIPFDELTASLQQVRQHEIRIFYTGNLPADSVQKWVENYLLTIQPTLPSRKDVRPLRKTSENELLLVNDKKAVQSQLYLLINSGIPRNPDKQPNISAFNQYFGSDMSSLVFQEIREFRSLAYSASARLFNGSVEGNPAFLSAYIGCQADKTYSAMETMTALIHDLPQKPEQIDIIKKSLAQSSAMARPFFRQLGQTVYNWQWNGYEQDPNIGWVKAYENLTFDSITDTWKNYIYQQPISFAVAGDKKKMKPEQLSTFGTIKELKLSDIRKK